MRERAFGSSSPRVPPFHKNTRLEEENNELIKSFVRSMGSIEKITYKNGDIYEGETKAGTKIKHGAGFVGFTNGDAYVGDWREDKMHGQGSYIFRDSSRYIG